jgi:hypothetical protein
MSSADTGPQTDGEKPPETHKAAFGHFKTKDGKTIEIRDVWASNLNEEMANIRESIEKYPYVAMVRYPYSTRFLFV